MGLLGVMARGGLVALAAAAPSACYEPRLRDCALTCSAASDCAGEQACHGGWCVAPGASCDGDGGVMVDARELDARELDASNVDAARTVELRIEVKGRGSVTTDASGVECGADGDCRFQVVAGVAIELTAVDGMDHFMRWRDACDGQGRVCTLTPTMMTRVKAEFMP